MIKALKRMLDELHAIREQHYEETKSLTPEERVKRINQEGGDIIKKYGLKFKRHHSLAHS